MNPLRRNEYEDYKETQKRLNKEPKWNDFLKLEQKQYLNFRVRVLNKLTMLILTCYILFILNL